MEADKSLPLEPHRRAVQEMIAETARSTVNRKSLVTASRSLAAVLQRHGLGQLLAYLQMRAGASRGPGLYDLLTRHLDRWLLAATGAAGRTALAALSTRDSTYYREASEQAWLFLRALRETLEESS